MQNTENNNLNILYLSNWSKKFIFVSGTVIEEKYTTIKQLRFEQ